MRFLADENIPGDAVTELETAGHDIVWVRTHAPTCDTIANCVGICASSGRPANFARLPEKLSMPSFVPVTRALLLRLANLPNLALDRLSRYQATLWRQARQTLLALDVLDRRKPQERTRRASVSMMPICDYDDC
ncbi:MAG: DUF5615 family PIN-like protein [Xanthobacteraceae bacterium]